MRELLITAMLSILYKIERNDFMMAMFFVQRVILGKTTFAKVPEKLKAQVREILTDSGLEELCEESNGN